MKRILLLAVLIAFLFSASGQKPTKIKYKGYFKNIPTYRLDGLSYRFQYRVGEIFKAAMAYRDIKLELKGIEQGDDLTFLLISSEPEIKEWVETIVREVNDEEKETFVANMEVSADSKLLVMDSKGNVLHIVEVEPDLSYINYHGIERPTYVMALRDKDNAHCERGSRMRDRYVKALFDAYQKELDNLFGAYTHEETLRVFTLKGKKYDYSDFNEATLAFQKATQTPQVGSDENRKIILDAISVWKSYEDEYEEGKKSKVSDVNIDAIDYNLMMGYLALGEGSNLEDYWDECLYIEGNTIAETYAKRYVPQMITNYRNSGRNEEASLKPIELNSDRKKFNDMIIMKAFLNTYLTSINENMRVMLDYFPAQNACISRGSSKRIHDDGTKETFSYDYNLFGKIQTLTYAITGGISDDRNIKLTFEYNENGISRVIINERWVLFAFKYENGYVSKVIRHYSGQYAEEITLKELTEGKIDLTVFLYEERQNEKVNSFSIKYNKDFQIMSLTLDDFHTGGMKYDEFGNWIEISGVTSENPGLKFPVANETDAKGNAIRTKMEGFVMESQYDYLTF
ncbi:MAG: hypothetical protein ACEPOZ_13970 [Marinifilaceae bacterium]